MCSTVYIVFRVFNFGDDFKKGGDGGAVIDSGVASPTARENGRKADLAPCRRRLVLDMS